MAKISCCATCGHPVPPDNIRDVLSPSQYQVFLILHRAGQHGITAEDIASIIYADDPDGGPDRAGPNVRQHIIYMRKRLERIGLEIPRSPRGGVSGKLYRVVKAQNVQESK